MQLLFVLHEFRFQAFRLFLKFLIFIPLEFQVSEECLVLPL
jgi:hypothetical protein